MMMSHGFVPANFMKTIIVPLVKNKAGNLQNKNNYRPIALASCVSKVMEKIGLGKGKDKLDTCSTSLTSLDLKAIIPLTYVGLLFL